MHLPVALVATIAVVPALGAAIPQGTTAVSFSPSTRPIWTRPIPKHTTTTTTTTTTSSSSSSTPPVWTWPFPKHTTTTTTTIAAPSSRPSTRPVWTKPIPKHTDTTTSSSSSSPSPTPPILIIPFPMPIMPIPSPANTTTTTSSSPSPTPPILILPFPMPIMPIPSPTNTTTTTSSSSWPTPPARSTRTRFPTLTPSAVATGAVHVDSIPTTEVTEPLPSGMVTKLSQPSPVFEAAATLEEHPAAPTTSVAWEDGYIQGLPVAAAAAQRERPGDHDRHLPGRPGRRPGRYPPHTVIPRPTVRPTTTEFRG